ncbi:MAG: PqqD family protein [Clostridia bacterium]|nr:PqqD family protein [Clostridia bacterium]
MKKQTGENYLERVPVRSPELSWKLEENGTVTLEKENTGIFNRIAQKLLKRPRISYIHLDETGSFVWPLIDGEKSIIDIGKDVDAHFGEAAHPLYERLAKYFQVMESYGFIIWKKN